MKLKNFAQKPLTVFLIFLFTGFLLYGISLKANWIFDDYNTVVLNKRINDLNWSFKHLFYKFRGLSHLTFALNYYFFKLQPFSYHLVNILIHVINSFLVFCLLKKTLKGKSLLALIAALFFLIHPVQTQAVSYISQRLESLAALFYLLTLFFYIKAYQEKRVHQKKGKKPFYFYLTLLTALLATTTKETSLTLPLALILYDWFFLSKSFKKLFHQPLWLLPSLIVFGRVLWVLVLKGFISSGGFSYQFLEGVTQLIHKRKEITRLIYLKTQINVIVRYISLVFVPLGLRLDYDFPLVTKFFQWPTWPNFLLILTIFLLAVFNIKKFKLACFGTLFFFLALIPTSSFFPIEDLIFEHRMYLSMVGAAFVLGELLSRLDLVKQAKTKLKTRHWILIAYFLFLCFLTLQRNLIWSDKFKLWQDNYKKASQKARVAKNFGVELVLAGRVEEGIELLKFSVIKEPKIIQYHTALAVILDKENRLVEAEKEYQEALKINDQVADIYFLLGNLQVRKEEFLAAIANFEKAISLDKNYDPAYAGLCSAYGGLKQIDKAISFCQQALEINPDLGAAHNNLYVLYTVKEDYQKATYHQRQAEITSRTFRQKLLY